jgi:hypothetical protein
VGSVVHHDVQPGLLRHGGAYGCVGGVLSADVEFDQAHIGVGLSGVRAPGLGARGVAATDVAETGVDGMAGFGEDTDGLVADSVPCTGDQDGEGGHASSPIVLGERSGRARGAVRSPVACSAQRRRKGDQRVV